MEPGGERWMSRRLYVPTPEVLGDVIRVYFAGVDGTGIGRVGFADVDASNPLRVLHRSLKPVLSVGQGGMFDCHGVTPTSILNVGGEKWLYYIGWQRIEGLVPPLVFIGLAKWDPGLEVFVRWSRVPIVDRTEGEPFGRSAGCVLDDGTFKLFYVGLSKTIDLGENPLFRESLYPYYSVQLLKSSDNTRWGGASKTLVSPEGDEFGLGRPWVLREADGLYRMWYSIRSRSRSYRIGYAESQDGLSWDRRDELAGIYSSDSGWDSKMICFAAVADAGGKRYMFYNGNNHGDTGFGVAVLDE